MLNKEDLMELLIEAAEALQEEIEKEAFVEEEMKKFREGFSYKAPKCCCGFCEKEEKEYFDEESIEQKLEYLYEKVNSLEKAINDERRCKES